MNMLEGMLVMGLIETLLMNYFCGYYGGVGL